MKDIKGYEGLYAADPSGKIWAYPKKLRGGRTPNGMRVIKGRFLKTFLVGHGYEVVSLYKREKQNKFLVHRLIALTHIPNPKGLKETNHINANIRDNRVENLEWVTSKQNKAHAIKLGLYDNNRGSKQHNAKLNEKQVSEIKELLKDGGMKQNYIAKHYGVSCPIISDIACGKTWKHII